MAELTISFRYPESAFLYRTTAPRLVVDDRELPVPGWGTHRFDVPAGPHQVRIWVPYTLPRRAGRAQADVTVPGTGTAEIEYMAPTITLARGSLGRPGEQQSTFSPLFSCRAMRRRYVTGLSAAVRIANTVTTTTTIIVVVVAFVVFALVT